MQTSENSLMKNLKKIAFICFIFFAVSCKNSSKADAQRIMGDWFLKTILFPDKIELVNKALLSKENWYVIPNQKKYTVLHYFMADCDKCIEELAQAQQYIAKKNDPTVDYIFLASGPTRFYVDEAIKKLNFKSPVYFEKEYWAFKTKNNFPLNEKTYDTILLNQKRQIVLFGGVFNNEKAQKLFDHYVAEN